jgi:hypothetical protein
VAFMGNIGLSPERQRPHHGTEFDEEMFSERLKFGVYRLRFQNWQLKHKQSMVPSRLWQG